MEELKTEIENKVKTINNCKRIHDKMVDIRDTMKECLDVISSKEPVVSNIALYFEDKDREKYINLFNHIVNIPANVMITPLWDAISLFDKRIEDMESDIMNIDDKSLNGFEQYTEQVKLWILWNV